uniref:Reverse transcriptase domain-containing protein n=1 Tax=Scleropages formosus TaxID=113540 RepID=A0A8C9VPJ5_SCLFO
RTSPPASHSSVLILLDLSAVFDTVNHRILLFSLSHLRFKGATLRWFESYLSDRSYEVVWQSSRSFPLPLSTGVPQGLLPGPLLFSIFTSSLGPVIASRGFKYHCYAAITQLFLSFPPGASNISAHTAACLSDISAQTSDYHLQLNFSKKEILHLPRSHVSPLFISLHWLPVTVWIKFKTLVIAYKCINRTGSSYLKDLINH